MSHTSSAVFAITVFAAPIVALGVVLARSGGVAPRSVARMGSFAATVVAALVAIALLTTAPRESDIGADVVMVVLALVPAVPWLLLRDEKPTEIQLVVSMLVSGALIAVFAVIGLVTTFGATVAESTNIGAGPGGFFVLLPAGAYVFLELKVFRAIRAMLRGLEAERATKAAAARAREPVVASPRDAKLRVRFEDCQEIRMGSPYTACKLGLDGEWTPNLPAEGWVRVSAFSPDRRFTGLAHWDTPDNSPGFHIVTIDCVERRWEISNRVDGFCQALAWNDDKFVPLVWHAPR
ncbi:MAG TPA: hypothetical protein VGP95_00870 [Gemmatimonadaceae bacterium]|nr:hypothetical protein [Gemmatimonadaceae bacterium]